MGISFLNLTPHDPLIARDGRPFGEGQGNRMRGLPWPLPSVVAGSFRTALIKSNPAWDFSWRKFTQDDLLKVEVAGVFPVYKGGLYLPVPGDCVWDENTDQIHRVQPIALGEGEGVDFAVEGLWPVRLTHEQASDDFKAKPTPFWWPKQQFEQWLTSKDIEYKPDWFCDKFLSAPVQSMRDHVAIDENTGANKEGHIFSSSNLNVTHLPRFGVDEAKSFRERFAEVTLSARITIPEAERKLKLDAQFDIWHPLGGERRMVHWQHNAEEKMWDCPDTVKHALNGAKRIRMVLTTPAIFKHGWKPDWLNDQLQGTPPRPGCNVKLKLVGVNNGRWKAVSGWSLQPHKETGRPGPKKIRRMVPAGSVYFFEVLEGDASQLAVDLWLQSVSDDEQERRDGFGLAVWGMWNNEESK